MGCPEINPGGYHSNGHWIKAAVRFLKIALSLFMGPFVLFVDSFWLFVKEIVLLKLMPLSALDLKSTLSTSFHAT